MTHGHFFEKLGIFWDSYFFPTSSSSETAISDFQGGDFSFDIDRRKVCVVTPRIAMVSATVGTAEKCIHGQNVAQTLS